VSARDSQLIEESAMNAPDTEPIRHAKACKKLLELPAVFTDWQQTTWCPECEFYDDGACRNLAAACPFDGAPLPVRQVAVEVSGDPLRASFRVDPAIKPESQPRSPAGREAIKQQILQQTGGRIQMLDIDITATQIVIRGRVPCYHVKQLALRAAQHAIRPEGMGKVVFDVQVMRRPELPRDAAQE
jgi:hypothetical protein